MRSVGEVKVLEYSRHEGVIEEKSSVDQDKQPDVYLEFYSELMHGKVATAENQFAGLATEQRLAFCLRASYSAFMLASKKGVLGLVESMYEVMHPEQRLEAVEYNDFLALRSASSCGKLTVVNQLLEWTAPDKKHAAITKAFLSAIKSGKLEVAKSLYSSMTEGLRAQIIESNCRDIFVRVVSGGHIDTAKWFYALMSDEQRTQAIEHDGCNAFATAAGFCSLPIVEWIYGLMNDEQRKIGIEACNYRALGLALTSSNHPQTAFKLIEWMSEEQLNAAIVQQGYHLFSYPVMRPAGSGMRRSPMGGWMLSDLEKLYDAMHDILDQDQLQAAIRSDHYTVFREASLGGHWPIITKLIDWCPHLLVYPDLNSAIYERERVSGLIDQWISSKLQQWHEQNDMFDGEGSAQAFDLDERSSQHA